MRRNTNMPVKDGQEIKGLKIESVGEKGDGIGKLDGYTIIVPNTNADDVVDVKVTRALPKYAFADVITG